jgi:hypothetical protein
LITCKERQEQQVDKLQEDFIVWAESLLRAANNLRLPLITLLRSSVRDFNYCRKSVDFSFIDWNEFLICASDNILDEGDENWYDNQANSKNQ